MKVLGAAQNYQILQNSPELPKDLSFWDPKILLDGLQEET